MKQWNRAGIVKHDGEEVGQNGVSAKDEFSPPSKKEEVGKLSNWMRPRSSADGRQIVFSSGRGNGPELWVVRNLLSADAVEN